MTAEVPTNSQATDAAARPVTDAVRPETEKETALASQVGLIGIIGVAVYISLFSLLLIYMLVAFWPLAAPAGAGESNAALVRFFWWQFNLNQEIQLLIIVAVAGALGGEAHALRSLSWYVGNRNLVRSWILYYILLPLVSATFSIVLYLVIRGGFFSPTASVSETSPFGFAALAALTGMFSQSAAEKLKEVADTLFKKPQAGIDTV